MKSLPKLVSSLPLIDVNNPPIKIRKKITAIGAIIGAIFSIKNSSIIYYFKHSHWQQQSSEADTIFSILSEIEK